MNREKTKELFKKYQALDGIIGAIEMYLLPIKTLCYEIGQQHFGNSDSANILCTYNTAEQLNNAQIILLKHLKEETEKLIIKYNTLFDEFKKELYSH